MLRNRRFLRLWLAQCISGAGDTFTFLALAVRINGLYPDAGSSAKALGAVLFASALPQVLVGLFAGTLVDRWDRRRVMIASDLARMALAPAFILLADRSQLPWALGLAFAMSAFSAFFYPARTALLPALVREDELMSANGWMQVGATVARLSGPVLAGVVVGRWGTPVAFMVDAASFATSAWLVLGIRGAASRPATARLPAWRDLADGLRFARGSRLLQGIALGLGLSMLGIGAVDVLFVPFLRFVFGAPPERLGLLMSAQGIGMLVGGLAMGSMGKRMSPLVVSVGAMGMLGIGVAMFGLAPGYTAALAVIPLVGLGLPPLNAGLQTLLQQGVPGEMMGRASAVVEMSLNLAYLTSMAAAGDLGARFGLRQTYLLAGAVMLAGGLAMGALLRGARRPSGVVIAPAE